MDTLSREITHSDLFCLPYEKGFTLLGKNLLLHWAKILHFRVNPFSEGTRYEEEQTGPEVIKLFSCSTHLSMKFHFVIKNKNTKNLKLFFMLNSAEQISKFACILGCINKNFMLSWVEHEKSFITLGPKVTKIDSLVKMLCIQPH